LPKLAPISHRFAFVFAASGWRGSQFIWRAASRLQSVKDGTTVRLSNGFPLIIDSQDWISKTIYEGTYERALLKFLDGLALSESYVDIGANIGVTLWHSLKGSRASATFMAFEPSVKCFNALGNTRMDIENQGQIFDYAIGDTDGKGTLFGIDSQAHSGAASLAPHQGIQGSTGEVQVHKLDTVLGDLLSEYSISLLKIDTEGYEAQVINGARETLLSGKVEIIVMEVSPNFGSVEFLNTVDTLLNGKYRWFYLDEGGKVRKTPYLRKINLNCALRYAHQWNLVLFREDIFEIYERSPGRIAIFG
jgi:FkbM family methyltransferase